MPGGRSEDGIFHLLIAAHLCICEKRRQRLFKVIAEVDICMPARRTLAHRRTFSRDKAIRQELRHQLLGHGLCARSLVVVFHHHPGKSHCLAKRRRVVHVGCIHELFVEPFDHKICLAPENLAPAAVQVTRQPIAVIKERLANGDLRKHGGAPPQGLVVVVKSTIFSKHRRLRPFDCLLRRRKVLPVSGSGPTIDKRIDEVAYSAMHDAACRARDSAVNHLVARTRNLTSKKRIAPCGEKTFRRRAVCGCIFHFLDLHPDETEFLMDCDFQNPVFDSRFTAPADDNRLQTFNIQVV